jgi:branched-chain amino acid transport system ATP-binding protein
MHILGIEGLTKNFGGLRATDGLSFNVEEGKLTSVIGPNGAGKTTLFNLITGMIRPDAGRVLFKGEEITRLPVHQIVRRGISRSFQIINLFNELTVHDNVWLGVQAQQGHGHEVLTKSESLGPVRDETERTIREIGLAGKEDTPVKGLSYGDRRLLEITVALTAKPSLLLLDEPMSGLMSEDRKRVAGFMRQLAGRLTLLVVEHAMDVVLTISDHIVVMHQGRLLAQGTPDQMRANAQVQEAYLGGQHAMA